MIISRVADRRMHEAQKFRGLHVDIFPYEGNMIPWLQRFGSKTIGQCEYKVSWSLSSLGTNSL